ncbi:hypothetical protein BaRGS_00034814 [Batillaria attramentaria]|uniref:Uncharacterized protein n=1 Tax=Batillaria attramentaria TaxID=370345 RepID=A0ABD0JGI4_9CAEN
MLRVHFTLHNRGRRTETQRQRELDALLRHTPVRNRSVSVLHVSIADKLSFTHCEMPVCSSRRRCRIHEFLVMCEVPVSSAARRKMTETIDFLDETWTLVCRDGSLLPVFGGWRFDSAALGFVQTVTCFVLWHTVHDVYIL